MTRATSLTLADESLSPSPVMWMLPREAKTRPNAWVSSMASMPIRVRSLAVVQSGICSAITWSLMAARIADSSRSSSSSGVVTDDHLHVAALWPQICVYLHDTFMRQMTRT